MLVQGWGTVTLLQTKVLGLPQSVEIDKRPVKKLSQAFKQQPTPEFLPEKSHGQKSLVGCGPDGHRELA